METPTQLPHEILSEILYRLPIKSIGRSRCVSKAWNHLLTSHQFIKTHLARITPLSEKLLLLAPRHLFTVTAIDSNELNGVVSQFDTDLVKFGGSCNGLVLIIGNGNTLFLMNPTIKEARLLPNSSLALSPYYSYSLHGFGYSSYSDDYKIVTLSYFDPEGNNSSPNVTFIDIYSLKLDSWRRIGISPFNHYSNSFREATASGVLLNGRLHWLVSKSSSYFIAAFNLNSEVFERILPPASINQETLKYSKLMVVWGRLVIVEDVAYCSYDLINLYIMNVYGLSDSWTKIVLNVENADWKKAICFWRSVLFFSVDDDDDDDQSPFEQYFVGYFFRDRDWCYVEVGRNEGRFDDGWIFSESLVSPFMYISQ